MVLSPLIPGSIERLLAWHSRFEALGWSRLGALRAAADRDLKRAYQQSRIEHLPHGLQRRLRTVVDVGANHGQWLTALLSVTRPDRVNVFEPNPAAVEVLRATLGDRPGVRIHAVAAGAASGTLPLNVTASSDFASFKQPAAGIAPFYAAGATTITSEVQVPVATLDEALADLDEVDLLKIDVQGFEREVIAGARALLGRTRAILIELNFVSHYQGDESLGTVTELLAREGFVLWDLSPPYRADDGRVLWCDGVFVDPTRAQETSPPLGRPRPARSR